jgi:hypothetical protein
MTVHERVDAILSGQPPDRLPFIDRLEVWHRSLTRAGRLPVEFEKKSLTEIHQAVGMGQERFVIPYALKLRGVDVISTFNGQPAYHQSEPTIENFPGMWDLVDYNRAGTTVTELITPVGRLWVQQELVEENLATGTEPYLREHLIKCDEDYKTVEYILEHCEFVPLYDKVVQEEGRLGGIGYVVPMPHRIPFQQVLLEYLGETQLFYELHDNRRAVGKLLSLLDVQLTDILARLAELPARYVEFPDNLHGLMTNPVLFAEFCLPCYQRYSEILHGQGKKVGSHTDGNVKPLLALLKESGLDVCESFSPIPLTPCTFEEAWQAWRGGPIIWGGIPSPVLEAGTSEADFREYVNRLLETVGPGPIILGVGDMVMGHNSIDRVRWIAERVEEHRL